MARTTTTIIRTTQGNRSTRRRASTTKKRAPTRARAKARAKPRAKPRTTRLTTTQEQRTAYKENANKTNWVPLLGLAGLLGLGGYLLIKNAQAGENPVNPIPGGGGVNPIPGGGGVNPIPGGGGGPSPGGFVHPPAGTRATVNATVGIPAGQSPGLKLRPAPAPGGATVGADLANGTPITVMTSNVVEQGKTAANKERWWQVRTNDGRTGFVRAVGPGANANAPYVWNVSFPGLQPATGRMMMTASYPSLPRGLQANYTQVFRGYDAYNRPVDQFGQSIPIVDPYQALVMQQRWGR